MHIAKNAQTHKERGIDPIELEHLPKSAVLHAGHCFMLPLVETTTSGLGKDNLRALAVALFIEEKRS